jgi:hypothetical protein
MFSRILVVQNFQISGILGKLLPYYRHSFVLVRLRRLNKIALKSQLFDFSGDARKRFVTEGRIVNVNQPDISKFYVLHTMHACTINTSANICP